MLDRLEQRRELLHQRCEVQVEEDDLVLGVVGDVADLVGKKARVDGVNDGARTGSRVVDLEVPEAVPGERADAVVHPHAQRLQRLGELARARVRVAEGVPMDRAVLDGLGDYFRIAVVPVRVLDQATHEQR
jgi:hypothetical protein